MIRVYKYENVFVDYFGNVFQYLPKTRKPERKKILDKDGYERVWIKNKKHRRKIQFIPVHKLMAIAFHGEPKSGMVCNHKNGIRTDNRPENLEWITPLENERHARNVLGKRLFGEKASRSKLKTKQIIKIRNLYKNTNKTQQKLAIQFGVTQSQIGRIIRKINWSHL